MGIISRTPTRVDLGGGTLDIMPLTHILGPKKTINFGVTLYAEVKVELSSSINYQLVSHDQGVQIKGRWEDLIKRRELPWLEKILEHFWFEDLPPLSIEVRAQSPAGAGLGGSSCLGIAMASALIKARQDVGSPLHLDEPQLVQTVQDLETSLIRVPTGCQDYWGGLRGGVNIISFPPGGPVVETIRADNVRQIEELLILCYSGVSRASASNNWAIFRKAFEGDIETIKVLEAIASISNLLAEKVKQSSWGEVFELSAAEWQLRKKLWSDIETPETQRIAQSSMEAGAIFSRICGAGGGGVMAIFAAKENHEKVKSRIVDAGGQILKGNFCPDGTKVEGELHGEYQRKS